MEARESERGAVRRAIDGEIAALLGVGGGEVRTVPMIGIRALMLAMLEDAVRAYLGADQRECDEAEAWIERTRHRWVFSFATVCETLGLEPPAVRTALQRLRARPPAERQARLARSRPNARQANLRIVAPRRRVRHAADAARCR